jgi:hypothetical protein
MCNDTSAGQAVAGESQPETTVGQMLDIKIAQSRKRTEALCIVKAKAEASGLLEFPRSFIEQVAFM